MLSRTLRVLIHADEETLWSVLMDRTRNPGRYQVGITETQISPLGQHSFFRETVVHGHCVKQRITTDAENGEVTELITEHPTFTGAIRWKLAPTARQSPVAPVYLECHIELQPKSLIVGGVVRGEDETLTDVQRELNQIREYAEGKSLVPIGAENAPEQPAKVEAQRRTK